MQARHRLEVDPVPLLLVALFVLLANTLLLDLLMDVFLVVRGIRLMVKVAALLVLAALFSVLSASTLQLALPLDV